MSSDEDPNAECRRMAAEARAAWAAFWDFPPPSVPASPPPKDLICDDKLRRLKWQIPRALDDIEVANLENLNGQQQVTWERLFPASSHVPPKRQILTAQAHPMASELVTEPGITRMAIELTQLIANETISDTGLDQPQPLVIEMDPDLGDAGITIGQFVLEVHDYATKMRELLISVGWYEQDAVMTWVGVFSGSNVTDVGKSNLRWDLEFADPHDPRAVEAVWRANIELVRGL